MVGGENDCVGRRHHRADCATGVAGIALVLLSEDFLERRLFASGGEVALSTASALLRTGDKEDLALSVREDDCALVASLADNVVGARRLSLPLNENRSHPWIVCGIM